MMWMDWFDELGSRLGKVVFFDVGLAKLSQKKSAGCQTGWTERARVHDMHIALNLWYRLQKQKKPS